MKVNKQVKEILVHLPHGSKKLIKDRTGISYSTIQKFLKGEAVSYSKAKSITIEAFRIYKEFKEREVQFMKDIMKG